MGLKLEVFDTVQNDTTKKTVVLDMMHLEETKLAAYDAGYAAGWEDAVAAQSDEQNSTKSELARSLQSLSFTYHEAQGHVLKSIRPLLGEIVGRLLPDLSRQTLALIVVETLMPMAKDASDAPVMIRLHPNSRASVEAMLNEAVGFPFLIHEEASLSEGQVYLKLGPIEKQINLDRAIEEIGAAVRNFFEASQKEPVNG